MNYLVAAYAAVWLILFIYLYSLKARQNDLEKTIQGLEKRLHDRR